MSSDTKGSSKKTVPQKPTFELTNGETLHSSFDMAGASSAVDSTHDRKATVRPQPLPEESADLCSGTYRRSVLKQEHQEPTDCVDWANGDQKCSGHLNRIPVGCLSGAHACPPCDDVPAQPNGDLREERPSAEQEVKSEPGDLTAVSRTGQEVGVIPQEEEELEKQNQRMAKDRCSEEKTEDEEEEEGGESEGRLAGKETWEESQGGATDILRLVMERRLKGRVPDDQETGYHTDRASSTTEQGGSDTEQDPRATGRNTAICSGQWPPPLSVCSSVPLSPSQSHLILFLFTVALSLHDQLYSLINPFV